MYKKLFYKQELSSKEIEELIKNSIEEIIEDYSRFTQKVLCYIIYNNRFYEIFYYKDISNNLNEYPIQIAKEVKQIPKIVMKWEYI